MPQLPEPRGRRAREQRPEPEGGRPAGRGTMVSKEAKACLGASGEGSQEKAMTVRSVLLRRDSPDAESRLQRRRHRTQQVRFKDLVDSGTTGETSPPPPPTAPHTPCASPPPPPPGGCPVPPAAHCASGPRQSWPRAAAGSLTLPRQGCTSTAIQTSPRLHKPPPPLPPGTHARSRSACDLAGEPRRGPGGLGAGREPPPQAPTSLSAHNHLPASPPAQHASRQGPPGPPPHATLCHGPAAPPRAPCPPCPGAGRGPAANDTSQPRSCSPSPELCSARAPGAATRCGSPPGSHGAPRPPPTGKWPPCCAEQSSPPRDPLPQPAALLRGHTLGQPAQGSSQRPPAPPQPWGSPDRPPPPYSPGTARPPAAPDQTPAALSHQGPSSPPPAPPSHSLCSCLRAPQPDGGPTKLEGLQQCDARPGQGAPPSRQTPGAPRADEPCLTAEQSETLRQVQDLLQLVAAAKGQVSLSKGDEHFLTSQGRAGVGARALGPGDMGDLRSQLQSLEGVLETSQQTIKVLLDVIQDLEKKEAQRDG